MRKLLLLSVLIFSSQAALARNVWRECGIGGMIFDNTGWAAITSNITWDLGTTATISNLSSQDLCEGRSASVAKFIYRSYAKLEEQTAMGSGEHLSAMFSILNCKKSSHEFITSKLQTNLSKTIQVNHIYMDQVKNFHESVMGAVENKFSTECSAI